MRVSIKQQLLLLLQQQQPQPQPQGQHLLLACYMPGCDLWQPSSALQSKQAGSAALLCSMQLP
jgi:hypothetical protein